MKTLHLRSYAKINLCLNITGKREDKYHDLDMVLLPISLHDSLVVKKLNNAHDHLVTVDDFSSSTFEYNLATLAINKLEKKFGFKDKFNVLIHKVIPIQAGLGGGSSNAAATLKAINELLKLGVSEDELVQMGKPLGCDVPFFVKNVPARCQGVGEIITPINVKNNYYVLIVKPEEGCSTRAMYALADQMDLPICDVEKVIKALEEGDDDIIANEISNALQKPAISVVPEIQKIIDLLKQNGLKIVQMSGSGSAVFALSTDKKLLKTVLKKIECENDCYEIELAKVLK